MGAVLRAVRSLRVQRGWLVHLVPRPWSERVRRVWGVGRSTRWYLRTMWQYACAVDKKSVSCSDPGKNACGGCGVLEQSSEYLVRLLWRLGMRTGQGEREVQRCERQCLRRVRGDHQRAGHAVWPMRPVRLQPRQVDHVVQRPRQECVRCMRDAERHLGRGMRQRQLRQTRVFHRWKVAGMHGRESERVRRVRRTHAGRCRPQRELWLVRSYVDVQRRQGFPLVRRNAAQRLRGVFGRHGNSRRLMRKLLDQRLRQRQEFAGLPKAMHGLSSLLQGACRTANCTGVPCGSPDGIGGTCGCAVGACVGNLQNRRLQRCEQLWAGGWRRRNVQGCGGTLLGAEPSLRLTRAFATRPPFRVLVA